MTEQNTKKVDDLTIEELNEQVAICQGYGIQKIWVNWYTDKSGVAFILCSDYDPCHNARQAFEIIEREKINLSYKMLLDGRWKWVASCSISGLASDDSLLISAMRCYVKSVKGETVEI